MGIDFAGIRLTEPDAQYVIRNRGIEKKEKDTRKNKEECISQDEKKMSCRAQQKNKEAKVSM